MFMPCAELPPTYTIKPLVKRRKKHKRCEYEDPHVEFFGCQVNLSSCCILAIIFL
jgi:hypothetical protein